MVASKTADASVAIGRGVEPGRCAPGPLIPGSPCGGRARRASLAIAFALAAIGSPVIGSPVMAQTPSDSELTAFDSFREGCLGVAIDGAMSEPRAAQGFPGARSRLGDLGFIQALDAPEDGALEHRELPVIADVGGEGERSLCIVSLWGGDPNQMAFLLDGAVEGVWTRALVNDWVGWVAPQARWRVFAAVAPVNPDGSAFGYVALHVPGTEP